MITLRNNVCISFSLGDNAINFFTISNKRIKPGKEVVPNKMDYDFDYNPDTRTIIYTILKDGTYSVNYVDVEQ